MNPKCAFIMTTFNGASKGPRHGEWLRLAMESMRYQDYDGEYLIVAHDDGSTDDTLDLLRNGCGYTDILFRSDDNGGISAGFNKAAQAAIEAGAEWLFPMGDDDLSKPNRLSASIKRVIQCKKNKGQDLGLIGSWIDIIGPKGELRTELAGEETEPEKIRQCASRYGKCQLGLGVCGIHVDIWKRLKGYDERMKWAADMALIFSALEQKILIGVCPKILYSYRKAEAGNTWNISHANGEEHYKENLERFNLHRRRTNPFYEYEKHGLRFDTNRKRKEAQN